jgi:hypothetical protein
MKPQIYYAMTECLECECGKVLDRYHDQVDCERCQGTGEIEVETTDEN